jgi:RNA polymerase subunit RPABC4/transcription elongation factor Spt4
MLVCPNCHEGIPEGMRFCLQCGVPLASSSLAGTDPASLTGTEVPPARPAAHAPSARVPARPDVAQWPFPGPPTVNPIMAPASVQSYPNGGEYARPHFAGQRTEIDEETLRKAWVGPDVQPDQVVCRFCKRPLYLDGEFCDLCGAPIAEAAPSEVLRDKGRPAASSAPPLSTPPQVASAAPGAANEPTVRLGVASRPPAAAPLEPARKPPGVSSDSQPTPPTEERPSDFVSRLKDIFKR